MEAVVVCTERSHCFVAVVYEIHLQVFVVKVAHSEVIESADIDRPFVYSRRIEVVRSAVRIPGFLIVYDVLETALLQQIILSLQRFLKLPFALRLLVLLRLPSTQIH